MVRYEGGKGAQRSPAVTTQPREEGCSSSLAAWSSVALWSSARVHAHCCLLRVSTASFGLHAAASPAQWTARSPRCSKRMRTGSGSSSTACRRWTPWWRTARTACRRRSELPTASTSASRARALPGTGAWHRKHVFTLDAPRWWAVVDRRGRRASSAAKGVEFRAEEMQPDLFLVRKILRTRPLAQRRGGEEAQAVFYVLRGVVYKSPTLMHVAFARLVRRPRPAAGPRSAGRPHARHAPCLSQNLASAALELAVRNEGHDSNYSSAHGVPLMGHMSVIPTDFESMGLLRQQRLLVAAAAVAWVSGTASRAVPSAAVAERKRVRDAQQLAARASEAEAGEASADEGHLRERSNADEEAARLPSTHRKAVQRVMQRVGQDVRWRPPRAAPPACDRTPGHSTFPARSRPARRAPLAPCRPRGPVWFSRLGCGVPARCCSQRGARGPWKPPAAALRYLTRPTPTHKHTRIHTRWALGSQPRSEYNLWHPVTHTPARCRWPSRLSESSTRGENIDRLRWRWRQ